MYIYTSGTTGYPEADDHPPLALHHGRAVARASSSTCSDGDCSYAPTPLYHGYSNFVGFAPGLPRRHDLRVAAPVLRQRTSSTTCGAHGATHFMYVGELCRYLLRQPPSPRDRAHRIRIATGPGLRPDIWQAFVDRFGIERVIETYGQTEANLSLMNRRGRVGSVGRSAPFTHDQLKLVRFDFERQQPRRGADGFLIECAAGRGRRADQRRRASRRR